MSDFVGKGSRAQEEVATPSEAVQHKPGKSTRVAESGEVHAQADAGTKGAGGKLPYLSLIQRSFGAHDVSGVRAHTGDAAADANAAMGSQAFARGNDVAFAGSPDLHTAAHEAAHVVQQRAGVHLKGGVGEQGDAYERHADAVADTVVAGGFAEPLLTEMAGPPGARSAGGGAVQHDKPTTPTPATGFQRVQDACAAANLPLLITLQLELRKAMLTDPVNPPQDARDGLAFARCWTMDRVAEIRDRFEPQIRAASTGATAGTDNTAAVEALEVDMDHQCTPYLDALMQGDPQYRYLHFNNAIAEKVFAAVRLHSVRRGVGKIGHRAEAEAEARAHGNLTDLDAAWCGVFAYTQAEQGGGFDPHWKDLMQGEAGIRGALLYLGAMKTTWIWAFDDWKLLPDYHAERGSLRHYEEVKKGPPAHGIQPGDIVLKDVSFGMDPDHITTAISFDGRYLTTVGGNEGTKAATDENGVQRSNAIDLQANPEKNDVRLFTDGKPERKVDPEKGPKNKRVHGIGRWSIVDYEQHHYVVSARKPTKPPASTDLAKLG